MPLFRLVVVFAFFVIPNYYIKAKLTLNTYAIAYVCNVNFGNFLDNKKTSKLTAKLK